MLADSATVFAAAVMTFFVRTALNAVPTPLQPADPVVVLHFFLWATPGLIAVVLAVNWAFGVYASARRLPMRFKWRKLMMALATSGLLTLSAFYMLQVFAINRSALAMFWGFTAVGLVGSRAAYQWMQRHYVVEARRPSVPHENDLVVVIGGAGYIGSGLVAQLLREGYRVRVLDLLTFGSKPLQAHVGNRRFELIAGDYRNVGSVLDAVRGAGAVVHLGGIVGDPACALNPRVTMSHNLYANKLIVEACKGVGVGRFVFASSCSVYGTAEGVARETSATAPVSLYAATKIDSEKMILAAHDRHFHPVCLRFATVFGLSRRPRFDLVVNLFAAQSVFDGRIKVINPQLYRPFVHTLDIAQAIVNVLESPASLVAGEVFNVGSDRINHSIGELGEIICSILPGTQVETETNSSDPRSYRVSFEKIQKRLGFESQVTLRAGINEIVAACRAGEITDYRDPIYNNHNFLKENQGLDMEDENIPTEYSRRFLAAHA